MMNGAWLMATSSQAAGRRAQAHKLRVQASSPSLQAPGYRLQARKYFFCASYERISGAGRTALSWVLMARSTLTQE